MITPSGQYRFTEEHVRQVLGIEEKPKGKVVIYARVSTQKQKSYLDSQVEVCKQFLASKGMQILKLSNWLDKLSRAIRLTLFSHSKYSASPLFQGIADSSSYLLRGSEGHLLTVANKC